MRILITGADGLLGSALTAEARTRKMDVLPLSREGLDVTNAEVVHYAVYDSQPTVIFNCAAFSKVDRAQTEPEEALAVNRDGARNVAESAAEIAALVVHISTDYVFDGKKMEPYLPTDKPAPLNLYGISKLAGEEAVRDAGPDHLIVRTSWLFGAGRKGFVDLVRDALGEGGDPLKIVNDQRSRPTWTRDLAPALLDLVEKGCRGYYHLANSGDCSRLELALEIRAIVESPRAIGPLASEDFAAPARRPEYSVLDLSGAERTLGRALPYWGESLRRFLTEEGKHQA